MTGVWVDTDFGFDDLWALLVLRHLRCPVAGVSLVAGNAPLHRVTANAMGARLAYGFDWPLWQGADRPLVRAPETAQRILGPSGMRSRGAALPVPDAAPPPTGAVGALRNWLMSDLTAPRTVLALGPLTNIAALIQQAPEAANRITRLVWMGGSAGRGNHTPFAEFNALADAEALACVTGANVMASSGLGRPVTATSVTGSGIGETCAQTAGLPMDIVDLEFCRKVTFGPDDLPETDALTRDLLGGYLDIALERGRPGMAIYDPLAALAIAAPQDMTFAPCTVTVSIRPDESYGATTMSPAQTSTTRLATGPREDLAQKCLAALEREALHGQRQ